MKNDINTDPSPSRVFFVGLGMALRCIGELELHKTQEMILKSGASYDDFLAIFSSFDLFSEEIEKTWSELNSKIES